MAEFGVGFKVFADASQFQREMRHAVESSKQVQRGLSDIGLNIGKLVGVTAIANFFTGTAKAAQELRDEVVKVGGTVDAATARVAAFGDGMDELKQVSVDASITVISWFNKMGDVLAYLPNRLTGVSAANEEMAMKVAADTEAALKLIAKARQDYGPEKAAAIDKTIQTERRKNTLESVSAEERLSMIRVEQSRTADEMANLGKDSVKYKERELSLERLNAEARKASADIAAEGEKRRSDAIKATERAKNDARKSEEEIAKKVDEELTIFFDSVEGGSKRLQETEAKRTEDAERRAVLAKEEADAAAKKLAIEQQLVALNEKSRADTIAAMSLSGLDRTQVQSAGTDALREIMRRKQGNLTSLGVGSGLTFDDNYFTRIKLQNEINQVKAELDMRNTLQRNVDVMGVEGARRAFGGDPLIFDKLVQQFVQDSRNANDVAQENNRLLTDMLNRFKNGIPVVNLNSK